MNPLSHSLLLKGGRVVDPASDRDAVADVLIVAGHVAEIRPDITEAADETLDCTGFVVAPGFIDMHVHLREPGQEFKETIETGTRAAVAGGFTGVACMANTSPVNDNVSVTESILRIAAERGHCRVWPIACVTKGMEGRELCEYGELERAGVVALSDDGRPVTDSAVLRRALEHAGMLELPIIDHAEDPALSAGGQMNEGWIATKLGLRGIPAAAEEIHVARDAILSDLTGSPIHVAHASTAGSIEIIRRAKRDGIRITCEAAPHHFLLDEESVGEYDTACKMKPPLRTAQDVRALLKGIADGTIDCIATDHAPHHADEKDVPFDEAAFGIVGLETAVSLSLHSLVAQDVVPLARLIALMSWNPARILGVEAGTLSVGHVGDVTVLDLSRKVTVDPSRFESKGRCTPFAGRELIGGPVATIVGGRIAWTLEGGVRPRG